VPIGANTWRVIVGSGHSPEHACLYCPALKVLISGDQILPRISSNVSVHPTEPDADPMSNWLDSLAKLKREVPDDVLVLPAHNECFRGLHARIDALARGQETSLRGCAGRSASRSASSTSSARCSRVRSARSTCRCSAWPPAKPSPA
jgi:glyoxylase-like metal-dependent hydrolase (beta-lactamase superfamily II)